MLEEIQRVHDLVTAIDDYDQDWKPTVLAHITHLLIIAETEAQLESDSYENQDFDTEFFRGIQHFTKRTHTTEAAVEIHVNYFGLKLFHELFREVKGKKTIWDERSIGEGAEMNYFIILTETLRESPKRLFRKKFQTLSVSSLVLRDQLLQWVIDRPKLVSVIVSGDQDE